eukprot:1140391-Amphidinium_carterae.1
MEALAEGPPTAEMLSCLNQAVCCSSTFKSCTVVSGGLGLQSCPDKVRGSLILASATGAPEVRFDQSADFAQ